MVASFSGVSFLSGVYYKGIKVQIIKTGFYLTKSIFLEFEEYIRLEKIFFINFNHQ